MPLRFRAPWMMLRRSDWVELDLLTLFKYILEMISSATVNKQLILVGLQGRISLPFGFKAHYKQTISGEKAQYLYY